MIHFTSHELILEHINTRMEQHGEEEILTLDLKISFDLPNTSLDDLSPPLRPSLFDPDDTDDMIDPGSTPNLRNPELGRLHWSGKWAPVLFGFDATDDESDDSYRRQ